MNIVYEEIISVDEYTSIRFIPSISGGKRSIKEYVENLRAHKDFSNITEKYVDYYILLLRFIDCDIETIHNGMNYKLIIYENTKRNQNNNGGVYE